MALATSNRDGGKTDEKGHLRGATALITGEIKSGFRVRQSTTPNSQVIVGGESGVDDLGFITNSTYNYKHPFWNDEPNTPISVDTPTPNTSNPTIVIIVTYIDYSATPSTTISNNANGVIKVTAIAGTPSAVPQRPTPSQIATAIGAANFYVELAQIEIPAASGTIAITDGMITDTRQLATSYVAQGAITNNELGDNSVTPSKVEFAQFQNQFIAMFANSESNTISFTAPWNCMAKVEMSLATWGYAGGRVVTDNSMSPTVTKIGGKIGCIQGGDTQYNEITTNGLYKGLKKGITYTLTRVTAEGTPQNNGFRRNTVMLFRDGA